MSKKDASEEEKERLVREALAVANKLCTAVIRGDQGQQRLALDFARIIDDARRVGHELT